MRHPGAVQNCCACGRPILTGEARWSGDLRGRPWHYACAEIHDLTAQPTASLWTAAFARLPAF